MSQYSNAYLNILGTTCIEMVAFVMMSRMQPVRRFTVTKSVSSTSPKVYITYYVDYDYTYD